MALWIPVAAISQELTEREAVRIFLMSSPYTQEFRAGAAVVDAQTRVWSVWPNPQAAFEHEGAGLTQITRVQQALPINGRLAMLRQAAGASVQVAEAQGEFSLWRLCSEMRRAFYDLIAAQQRESIITDGLAQLQEIVRILGEREKHGEGSLFDKLRAEQEQSEIQADLSSVRALTAEARSRLLAYLGGATDVRAARAQGDLTADHDLPPLAEVMQAAFDSRQDFRAEKQRHEQFEWEDRAVRRQRIPDPVVAVGFKRTEEAGSSRYGPFIGVTVSVPLFERGQNRTAELEAEMRRSSYRQEVLDQQIQAEVRGAYEELQVRRQAWDEYRGRLAQQGAQLEQIAKIAYEEGELGILELLDSYRVRRQSLFRMLELAVASRHAEVNLERAVGKPVLNPEVLP